MKDPIRRMRNQNHPGSVKKGDKHPIKGQKRLNALRDNAVPPGGVLNPYGTAGSFKRAPGGRDNVDHLSTRPEALKRNRKRKRLQLQEAKKIALEFHELQQMARENATGAMKTLIDISENERAPEPSRIAASAIILDRAYGKSTQVSVSASVNNGKTNDLSGDELDKRISQTLTRVEELTRGASKKASGQKRPADLRKLN